MSDGVQIEPVDRVTTLSDEACIRLWRQWRGWGWDQDAVTESLRTVVERYWGLVYASALRRTGDAAQAAEVTLSVFLVLARRARKLSKKTVLAGWLFDITRITCRKLKPKPKRRSNPWFVFVWRKPKPQLV